VTEPGPIVGRVVGVLAGPGADLSGVRKLGTALRADVVAVRVIATAGGELGTGANRQVIDRTLLTTRSIEYDAIVVADRLAGPRDVKLSVLLQEAFRHCKPLGDWGNAGQVLRDAGIDVSAPGIVLGDRVD
jgi:catalase